MSCRLPGRRLRYVRPCVGTVRTAWEALGGQRADLMLRGGRICLAGATMRAAAYDAAQTMHTTQEQHARVGMCGCRFGGFLGVGW